MQPVLAARLSIFLTIANHLSPSLAATPFMPARIDYVELMRYTGSVENLAK